jgi:hypothetical protein
LNEEITLDGDNKYEISENSEFISMATPNQYAINVSSSDENK